MKITGYKTLGTGLSLTADATFQGADFMAAIGFSTIEPPFSLAIDIDAANLTVPMYFGIEIVTDSGSVMIADRTNIGFVVAGERKVISSASVPQLAKIAPDSNVTKIIVHCYFIFPGVNDTVKLALWFDTPNDVFAPQPYIGRDTIVNNPFTPIPFFGSGSVPAATPSQIIVDTLAINAGLRYRINSVHMWLQDTAAVGTLFVRFQINTPTGFQSIARIDSMVGRRMELTFNPFIILPSNGRARANATNSGGAAGVVECTINGEYIL